MTEQRNPFEFVAANDLPAQRILSYYIEDYNYSRFIASNRNVLLVGERGSGKSMTLLYNSWPLQSLKGQQEHQAANTDLMGVYVPCNTPLIHKKEYQLLDPVRAAAIAEHHFVLSIAQRIAETLKDVPNVMEGADEERLRSKLAFVFGTQLPDSAPFFDAITDFVEREALVTQRAMNDAQKLAIEYEDTFTFASLIIPLLGCARTIPCFRNSHFMLLIDDAHDLNEYQARALNSWMAFRDHSLFSLKVAMASIERSTLCTASGGAILEGHDYIKLDMVQPFQNEASEFGKLAELLIAKRLSQFKIGSSPEEFFPTSQQLQQELAVAEAAVRREAEKRYGNDRGRVSDHVYKYKRAYYFRNRPAKANRPEYSGFQTLVYLSTGVIRNLLQPCYWMFEKVLSENSSANAGTVVEIPPSIQSDTIIERSRGLWDWLRDGLDQNIVGCSREDAKHAYQLLDQLALLFRERLLHHQSEPRANSFTVSGFTDELVPKLEHVFDILRQAQLLYVRSGVGKEKGKRERYYVPNRLLWPERGLDPHGQHARVSIPATDLWAAASENRSIPSGLGANDPQKVMFDE